jgi:restriction system protein
MTIIEAVLHVMRAAGQPLTPGQVFAAIQDQGLYSFGAKDPLSIVRAQLRRHTMDYHRPTGASTRYFERLDGDRYTLSPTAISVK